MHVTRIQKLKSETYCVTLGSHQIDFLCKFPIESLITVQFPNWSIIYRLSFLVNFC